MLGDLRHAADEEAPLVLEDELTAHHALWCLTLRGKAGSERDDHKRDETQSFDVSLPLALSLAYFAEPFSELDRDTPRIDERTTRASLTVLLVDEMHVVMRDGWRVRRHVGHELDLRAIGTESYGNRPYLPAVGSATFSPRQLDQRFTWNPRRSTLGLRAARGWRVTATARREGVGAPAHVNHPQGDSAA